MGASEITIMLKSIQNYTEKISRLAVFAGGMILVLAACLVVFEVIARKLFSFTITGVEELSGYAYAISMAWGFSFTLFQRGHIRVDVVYVRLPYRLQRFLDVISLLSLSGLIVFLCTRAYSILEESITLDAVSSSPLQVPLWIPQSLWLSGLFFFAACLILLLSRSFIAFLRSDYSTIEEIAHAPTIEEETQENIDDATTPVREH